MYIPVATFPKELPYSIKASDDEIVDVTRNRAQAGIKEWFPEKWEAATGEKVTADESRIVAKREWLAQHTGQPIVKSASTADSDPDWVRVTAATDGGETAEYLVPKAEYKLRDKGFVVDLDRHPVIAPREPQAHDVKAQEAKTFDFTEEVEAARRDSRSKVCKDFEQRWAHSETGKVRSLAEIIGQEGVVERMTYFSDAGRPRYAVNSRNGSFKVSKETFDFLGTQIPDGTTESSRLSARHSQAAAKADRLKRYAITPRDREAANQAQQEADLLREASSAAFMSEREAWKAANGSHQERAALEKQVQIKRERHALEQHRNGVAA